MCRCWAPEARDKHLRSYRHEFNEEFWGDGNPNDEEGLSDDPSFSDTGHPEDEGSGNSEEGDRHDRDSSTVEEDQHMEATEPGGLEEGMSSLVRSDREDNRRHRESSSNTWTDDESTSDEFSAATTRGCSYACCWWPTRTHSSPRQVATNLAQYTRRIKAAPMDQARRDLQTRLHARTARVLQQNYDLLLHCIHREGWTS